MTATTGKPGSAETFSAMLTSRERLGVCAVLMVGLGLRLFVLNLEMHKPVMQFFSHPWEMGLLGKSILEGHGYSSPFGFPTGPTAFIAPGYPTIVAGIFFLFGVYSVKSALVIILLNIAAALTTVALIMRLARNLFSTAAAWTAGLFWAVSLPLLWLPIIFWESSFSALFFVLALTLALRTRRAPTASNWAVLGLFTAVAALINPALIFSFTAIMGWVAFQTWRRAVAESDTARTFSWRPATLGAFTLFAVFVAWPVRNAVRFHAFIPLRSTVGFEMWMGNHEGSTGHLDESIYPMTNPHELAAYIAQGEVAYVRGKSAAASAYIASHPAWFVDMTARRIFRFWSGTGNAGAPWIYEAHALSTTLLGFIGLVLLFRRDRSLAALFALPMLLFPVPYYLTHAEFRYRLNLDPVMTILAAYAAVEIVTALARRTKRVPAAAQIASPLAH